MKTFYLGKNKISFSDEFDDLNQLRLQIKDGIQQSDMSNLLEKAVKNVNKEAAVEKLVKEMPEYVNQVMAGLVTIAIDFLVEHEIYTCNEVSFINKYMDKYFNFANTPQYQKLRNNYLTIIDDYTAQKEWTEYQRAHRSQWVGGGFGITGAIKGSIQAGAMNMVTGAFRGIGDAIGDAVSSSAFRARKGNLLNTKNLFEDLGDAYKNCIFGIFFACEEEYAKSNGFLCPWESEESQSKAAAIFSNVKSRIQDPKKALTLLCGAIQLYPYNEEYFMFLYDCAEVKWKEIECIAKYLGYSLDSYRIKKVSEKIESIVDEYFNIKWICKVYRIDESIFTNEIKSQNFDKTDIDEWLAEYLEENGDPDFMEMAKRYYECEHDLIDTGKKLGFINDSLEPVSFDNDKDFFDASISILSASFNMKICGIDSEKDSMIQSGNYTANEHECMLLKIKNAKKEYDYDTYPQICDEEAQEIISAFTNSEDLEEAADAQRENTAGELLKELDVIIKNSALNDTDKIDRISLLAIQYGIVISDKKCTCTENPELANIIAMGLAHMTISERYDKIIQKEIINPDLEIYKVNTGIRNILFDYGIIETVDSHCIAECFLPKYYFYSSYYACNDYFNIVNEIIEYIEQFKYGSDYRMRNAVGKILHTHCKKNPPFKNEYMNLTNDPNFGRNEYLTRRAKVPNNDLIYAYFIYGTILGVCGSVLTDSGIYSYCGTAESCKWNDIARVSTDYNNIVIRRINGEKIECRFGNDADGFQIINGTVEDLKKWVVSPIITENQLYNHSMTFVNARLEYFLTEEEKKLLSLGSSMENETIHYAVKECSEIIKLESNPHINLYFPIMGTVKCAEDLNKCNYLLITNNYLYIPLNGAVEAIPLVQIETISGASVAMQICTKKGSVYTIRLKAYGSEFDYSGFYERMNKALVIQPNLSTSKAASAQIPSGNSGKNLSPKNAAFICNVSDLEHTENKPTNQCMMFCTYCGKSIHRTDKFCTYCGSKNTYQNKQL